MHEIHGDIHEIGLQDDCSECMLHAENPFNRLDHTMLSNLVVMTLTIRANPLQAEYPRSNNEAIARANVMHVLERMGKVFEVMQLTDQLGLAKAYFRDYWRIEF